MSYMEREHGFKATQQMYKKRFTKWGFVKNRRRDPGQSSRKLDDKPSQSTAITNINMPPPHHSLAAVVTGIRDWSTAALESGDERNGHYSTDMYSTFILASELLSHGQGSLAGKAIRKAFVLLESGTEDDSPVVMWNLVDMMYEMAVQEQTKLLQLYVGHFARLSQQRLPGDHPLVRISREMPRHTDSNPADFMHLLEVARKCNIDMLDQYVLSPHFSRYRTLFWDSCLFRMGRCPDPDSDRFVASVWLQEKQADLEKLQDPTTLSIRSLLLELSQIPLTSRAETQRMANELLHDSQDGQSLPGVAGIAHHSRTMLAKIELQVPAQVPQTRSEVHAGNNFGRDENPRIIRETWYLEKLLQLTEKKAAAAQVERDACEKARKYLEDISNYTA
ncbi:hypothetical protein QQZ08_004064 [Neonectria magnoliae]|uniref:Clr5 domain-containing protein n=1 Tax=Neonectria magnoliae TaxID=2732573 RepID=A0ABR1I990_9HYPO